jgi:hypothetical protein
MEIKQTVLDDEQICRAIEQKFAAGTALTGVAPSLSSEPAGEQDFVPFMNTDDGIIRMKNPGPTAPEGTLDEADAGGLFSLDHKQPTVLEHIYAYLGTADVAWTAGVVTSAGEFQLGAGTGKKIELSPRMDVMPGEKVKVTCAAPTGKPWVRIYIRSDQARH